MKPGIIVLGGHVQSYGIVRIYGQNSVPAVVIDRTKHNISRHSKYCQESYVVAYDDLIEFLVDFGRKGMYGGWLLIPTDDYYVRLISQNKEILDKHFRVTVDDWEMITPFFNKKLSYPLAQAAGVPFPKTMYPESSDDVKKMASEIDYPCIIKPAVMLDFYRHFKKKVFVCHDPNDLEIKYRSATKVVGSKDLLIQEIIPGSSEHQYSVGMFYDRNQAYNCLVARRKRQHPIDFGNATTYAETVDVRILVEYAHRILSMAEFFGICEVEFKYDHRTRQYKFLEVNPRTWKWHTIADTAQVPFLMSLYNYYCEKGPVVKCEYENACWQDVTADIPMQIRYLLDGSFKKTDSQNRSHAVFNIRDIRPFVFQLAYLPFFIISR